MRGLKFDLRIYVLVTGCDPLRIFLYKDGLVRFATEQYEPISHQNKKQVFKHLTNFAINKDNPNFISNNTSEENKDSHKRSIREFFSDLKSTGVNTKAIWAGIKRLVVKTLVAVQPTLKQYSFCQMDDPYNQGCFEILGFDVMVSKDLVPILLEVNHNPSLTTGSVVDTRVKEGLVRDTLNILGVSLKTKQKLTSLKKSFAKERIMTGRRTGYNKDAMKESCMHQRDNLMLENKGGFERIYPAENENDLNEPYDQFLHIAEKNVAELNRSQSYWNFSKSSLSGQKASLFSPSTVNQFRLGSVRQNTRTFVDELHIADFLIVPRRLQKQKQVAPKTSPGNRLSPLPERSTLPMMNPKRSKESSTSRTYRIRRNKKDAKDQNPLPTKELSREDGTEEQEEGGEYEEFIREDCQAEITAQMPKIHKKKNRKMNLDMLNSPYLMSIGSTKERKKFLSKLRIKMRPKNNL